jgi:nicotinic acetylcholine receptor
MFLFKLVLFLGLLADSKPLPDEHRLLQKNFRSRNYDNSVRPVYNATTSVAVTFGLTLIQIMDMVS